MKVGASWLKADLVITLDALPLGGTTTLDYRGRLADAPHFTLSRTPTVLVVMRSHTARWMPPANTIGHGRPETSPTAPSGSRTTS